MITLIAGRAITFELQFLNELDAPEDLTGASEPKLYIRRDLDAGAIVAAVGTLLGAVATFALTAFDTMIDEGVYVAAASVKIGDDMYESEPFYLQVQRSLTE